MVNENFERIENLEDIDILMEESMVKMEINDEVDEKDTTLVNESILAKMEDEVLDDITFDTNLSNLVEIPEVVRKFFSYRTAKENLEKAEIEEDPKLRYKKGAATRTRNAFMKLVETYSTLKDENGLKTAFKYLDDIKDLKVPGEE